MKPGRKPSRMTRIMFNNTQVPRAVGRHPDVRVFGALQKDTVPVFSGKTALASLLRYYRSTGALEDKMAEVLVPPWLGTWVYMTMQKYCFPVTTPSARTRGMLLYHQWGFPQRVNEIMRFAKKKQWFVIEDCAHAFEGRHDGQRLGTFGDAAIFSLAKFFPCVVGGAVRSSNPAIRRFVRDSIPPKPSAMDSKGFSQRLRYDKDPSKAHTLELEQWYGIYDRLQACHPKALAIAADRLAHGAIRKRRDHVRRLREAFDPRDRFRLYDDDVTPWVVPLFFGKPAMQRITEALQAAGVESGIYRFDVNRNMLDPDYRPCLAVPCHDGISENQMHTIIRIIASHL